ncbi:hypothetical protein [Fatsia badnavirus 1]|uniref:Uncharacterized protein n=1 Tax=Fatsia badnavirus 1 TaxID=2999080 RepID=A0A9E8Z0J8_9VIRU|nr:hypothetical protein [Fatsia badnavirus 1]
MSLINAKAAESYIEALEATDSIQSPAQGFVKPEEVKGALTGQTAQIKQLNTIIHLLIQVSNKLNSLEDRIDKLELKVTDTLAKETQFPTEVLKKLDNLKLGEGSSRRREAEGKVAVFTDPRLLIKKAKQQQQK